MLKPERIAEILNRTLLGMSNEEIRKDMKIRRTTVSRIREIFPEYTPPKEIVESRRLQRIWRTCYERHGQEYAFNLAADLKKRISKFQRKVERALAKHFPDIKTEQSIFRKFNKKAGRIMSPRVDILIPSKKVVIECQGDYFHANPSIYKPKDKIERFKGPKTAQQIWDEDKLRIQHIRSFGYRVLLIWESDFKKDPDGAIRKLLKNI